MQCHSDNFQDQPSTSLSMPSGSNIERLGPRPLAFHIAQAELAWRSADQQQLANFYHGIKAYRDHPYRRGPCHHPAIWREGECQLLDFGPKTGWPLLVIPSLINRAYILDLLPDASMLGYLSKHGIRPLLLDWGDETARGPNLTLEELVLKRMQPALESVLQTTGRRPILLGYCMGGTLATALACLNEAHLTGLALLATPWSFDREDSSLVFPDLCDDMLASVTGSFGGAPIDLLQGLFAQINPLNVPKKFAEFATSDLNSHEAVRFVAIEDWLNDGVPLSAEITATCMRDWYKYNAPGEGVWQIDGQKIQPNTLKLRSWLAVPDCDRIVPPQSALFLANTLANAELMRPRGGHVGMVAGSSAEHMLWRPLLSWLKRIAATQKELGERWQ